MSAAAARLPPGEGALGGEVVGDEVPGRDGRAETRVPRSARRAHLEHLAALPAEAEAHVALRLLDRIAHAGAAAAQLRAVAQVERSEGRAALDPFADRKSTRLNSSHRTISYAVFCLKKKKKNKQTDKKDIHH